MSQLFLMGRVLLTGAQLVSDCQNGSVIARSLHNTETQFVLYNTGASRLFATGQSQAETPGTNNKPQTYLTHQTSRDTSRTRSGVHQQLIRRTSASWINDIFSSFDHCIANELAIWRDITVAGILITIRRRRYGRAHNIAAVAYDVQGPPRRC